MKITYISHATLLIEIDGVKLVTDPWIKEATYCNQWHLFPKALSPDLIKDADYVLYSHGHEDHLHAASLQTINKNAAVFYPYSWYDGTPEFFNSLGFKNVTEAFNERTIALKNGIRITFLSNNLDHVMVIESKDRVLVDINDALPSASASMISYFIDRINKRWKKIDYIFSSYGGAAYFPNTVHYSLKNDMEIAETRELFFLNNFCKIISGLNPTFAIPFATDFVLLDDNQRWINTAKFPRKDIPAFYANYTKGKSKVQVISAYPNDYFVDDVFHKVSPYHNQNLLETIDSVYAKEIAEKRNPVLIGSKELSALMEKIKKHILNKQYIIPESTRHKIKFALKITDATGTNFLTVDFRKPETEFVISSAAGSGIDLLIELKSKTISYSLDNEWGGDAIIIGYGAEIQVYNEDSVLYEYENYCIRLLSRYPNTKEYLKKAPFRAIKYLLSDSIKRNNLKHKALGNADKIVDYTDPVLGKRDLWLNKDKCEVCKACNI